MQGADLVDPGGQGREDLGAQTARTAGLDIGLFDVKGGGAGGEVGAAVLGGDRRGQTGGGERQGCEQAGHCSRQAWTIVIFGSSIWPRMKPSPSVGEVGASRMARTTSMP